MGSSQVPISPDVLVHNEGSLFLFCPLTSQAKEWIDENVQPDAQLVWECLGRRASFRLGSRAGHEGCRASAGVKGISAPSDVYKYREQDAIDWLELHVNYAGEDLTWNDLMFIRME